MLKDAGQLCKATDALPFYVLEGGQNRTITPASSVLHTCKSFYRQKTGEQTQKLIRHLLPHSLISEQRHHLPLPIISQPWAQRGNGPSSAANTCMAQTPAPITCLAQVTQGQRPVLCESGCAAFGDSLIPKTRFLCSQ